MTYNKYKVSPKADRTADNIVFASKKEMLRYLDLKLLVRAGEISELQLQPDFILQMQFQMDGKKWKPIIYQADFQYIEPGNDRFVVEDTKGFKNRVFRIKEKMFRKKFGDKYELRLT